MNHNHHRPFRVLGLQQIAIGGLDKGPLMNLFSGLLGIEQVGTFMSESENVVEDILSVGPSGHEVEIDIMQPLDPNKKPKVHEPTLNHIGLWVDKLEVAREWLETQGVRFAGPIRKGASGHDICFIHPKGNGDFPFGGEGVLIELVQAPEALLNAHTP